MIIAVGERGHWPHLSEQGQETWRQVWIDCPVSSFLTAGAFQNGYGRLGKLGFVPHRGVNLLPPRADSGVWDKPQASAAMWHVLQYAAMHGGQLALMGRRVCNTFVHVACQPFVEFGDQRRTMVTGKWVTRDLRPVHALALPHPSGRSRWLNDEDAREMIRDKIHAFHCYDACR